MTAELFLAITAEVFAYALAKLDLAEKAKVWLKRDPASLAFQKVLARSYAAFARQYPEYAATFFDKSFLTKEAVPELSKMLVRNQHPDPALLAQAWGESLHRDIEFSKQAIKPASDFLTWIDAEMKGEQAFQPLYDSRSLDNIGAGIEKLTEEVRRALDAALKSAEECSSIIEINGDVKDSVIMPGYNNQITINHYYSGVFLNLRNFYEPPDVVFDRVHVKEFIGRAWLTAKVKDFLNDPKRKSGAFLIEGEAGVGKSAFMAHLVSTERYLHLFGEQFAGESRVQAALLSLGSQIITRFRLTEYERREDLIYLAGTPQFLQRLLSAAVQKLSVGEKIVIVCDALDEAGNFPDGNVFGLPNTLPDGVYFILSQRPVPTKLPNYIHVKQPLDPGSDENLRDMEDFLRATAKRNEIASQLHAWKVTEATFIRTLKEKSLGVWIYLYYVLDIQNGYIVPLDLENLPTGLAGYYNQYWSDWRDGKRGHGEGRHKWDALYAPLLTTLAAAQEAVTTEQLIAWSGVQATPQEVRRCLREDWRAFITERASTKQSGKIVYSPYHLSFRDFLTGRVDLESLPSTQASFVRELAAMTTEAHKRIVSAFEAECTGEWERLVKREYPRLHLSAHLAGAGEYEQLRLLLTEGDEKIKWAEARYKEEETYSGFLADLQVLWAYIEKEQDYALAIRCMLIENSIHSLASNILPELLVQLGKTGIWSYPRCLATVRENSDSGSQATALKLLALELPPLLLQEALAAAREIKDEDWRARALSALVPHLSDELKSQALQGALAAAREIKDESARARALSALAPHLSGELKPQALQDALAAAREIKAESGRASALSDIVPHLSGELKPQALQDALGAAREIKDEYYRARALSDLAPHLSDPPALKLQVLQEALAAARKIKDEDWRARALSALAPHLSGELKPQALQDALAAAREIKDEGWCASALSDLAPHLSDELKPQALIAAREIKAESARARALSALAPYLSDELKSQALQNALAAAREIKAESDRARALSDLAPHLSGEFKPQAMQDALVTAREIKDESDRARALSDLAPHLSDPPALKLQVLQEALAAAREIKAESARASALSALAPHLSGKLKTLALQDALAATREIKDESARARALSDLAPHLSGELKPQALQDALAATREIKDESDRARALSALAPHLSDELKPQALAAAREIKDESDRASALFDLAPHLSDELKPQALAAAREIKDESARASALSALAPHLSDELKPQALATAREIKDERNRARALSDLAPYLSDELKPQALAAAREIKDESDRARALSALAPHLSGELKPQALAAAREIKDEYARARALSALAPHLSGKLKPQALQDALAATCEIKDEYARARALSALAPHLSGELKPQALQDALAAAREIKAESDRAIALSDLASHLSDELKPQALAATREIKDEDWCAIALSALAPHLSDKLKPQALIAAREIKAEFARAIALSALAPYLSDELKPQALVAAREIKAEYARVHALSALAPHLNNETKFILLQEMLRLPLSNHFKGDQLGTVLSIWQEIEFTGLRGALIPFIRLISQSERGNGVIVVGVLAPAFVHFCGKEIVEDLLRAIRDTARWWA